MRKKKEKLEEEPLQNEEIPEEGEAQMDDSHPEMDSDLPQEDQEEILEGEILSNEELSPDEDIPIEERLELIQAALEASEAKAAEYFDGWQRARAEFTNYRKRQERERELMRFETVGRVAKRYLPIVDDLQRAIKDRPTEENEGPTWAEGIDLIYRKLMSILEAEGVTPIEAEGQMFDPNLHEAVVQSESEEHESGIVIEVLQTGYQMGDRVLRPAVVRVAA